MTTADREIATPTGPVVGRVWGKLDILGVSSLLTQTLNQSDDRELVMTELVWIDVPPGTELVVPSVNFWNLAYGSMTPDPLNALDENTLATWNNEDHNWGLGWVQVSVVELTAPDFSVDPPRQKANLRIALGLTDDNGDDAWFGKVGYSLIFFGNAGTGMARRAASVERATAGTQRRPAKIRSGKLT